MAEEMFIGRNDKGLVVGDPSVLVNAHPQDKGSVEMLLNQKIDGAMAVPYVEEVVAEESVSAIMPTVEPELCM